MLFLFVAYSQEHCDDSIGCGTHVFDIEASSNEEALAMAKEYIFNKKGWRPDCEDRISTLHCYSIKDVIAVDIGIINNEYIAKKEHLESIREFEKAKAKLDNAKEKLEQFQKQSYFKIK